MKAIRWITSFILSLTLSFILIFLQFSVLIDLKLLNTDYYIGKYEKKGLYNYTYENVNANLGKVSRTSNLPIELFSNIVTKQYVKNKADFSTKELVDYLKYKTNKVNEIDTKPLSDKFNSNLDDYMSKQNYVKDNSVQNELNNVKVEVANSIKYQSSTVDVKKVSNSSSFNKFRRVFYYVYHANIVLIILIFINIFLLFLSVREPQGSLIMWIGYSLLVGGLLTLIPAIIALSLGFFNNIAITKGALKSVVVSIIKDSISFFVFSGGVLIVLSFICFIYVFIKNNKCQISENKYS